MAVICSSIATRESEGRRVKNNLVLQKFNADRCISKLDPLNAIKVKKAKVPIEYKNVSGIRRNPRIVWISNREL